MTSATKIQTLIAGELPIFDNATLATVNQAAATIDIIDQAGDLSHIDDTAVQNYQTSAGKIQSLIAGELPIFDSATLATVNQAAATIDIIDQAGDLSHIDDTAVQNYQTSADKIQTLINGGLPVFDNATLATVNQAAATIDIIDQVGDLSHVNQTTIDGWKANGEQINELLNANLPIITEEQKAQTETILASVDRLENMTVPDLTGRVDEINTAKANVDFILGLSDLPTQEELNEADAKVQQLGSLLPSWQQMNATIANLISRVQALETNGSGSSPSGPTTFEASGASVTNANPKKITVTLPEDTYTGENLQASDFQVSVNDEIKNGLRSHNIRQVRWKSPLTSYVPYSATVLLTFTGTVTNENGDEMSMSSFSVTNDVSLGKQLVSSKTYQTDDMNIELVVDASGTATFTDYVNGTYDESTGEYDTTTYQYNASSGFYEDSTYTNCIHFFDVNDENTPTTFTGTRNGESFSVTEYSIPDSGGSDFPSSGSSVTPTSVKVLKPIQII